MRKENQSSRVVGERIGHKEGNEAWGELASHLKLLAALSYPLSVYRSISLEDSVNALSTRKQCITCESLSIAFHVTCYITENATNF